MNTDGISKRKHLCPSVPICVHLWFAAVAGIILLVALVLRIYRLPELPVGLHYDEAANVTLAAPMARGESAPIFIEAYTGKEVLFFYLVAAVMRVLGPTPLALRLTGALVGVATVAAAAWMARELLHGRRGAGWVALFTAAFMATSFWHVVLSRYGFRAVSQPLLQALAVAALWRALRTRAWGWFAAAGVLVGLTAYTYLPARLFPIPLALALVVSLFEARDGVSQPPPLRAQRAEDRSGEEQPPPLQAARQRRAAGEGWGGGRWREAPAVRPGAGGRLALFAGVAALIVAPLAYYWYAHPGSFGTRIGQVAAASWSDAWRGLVACLGMFFVRGDPYIRFNLPGRPLFDPVTAGLFLLGIGIVLWALVAPRHAGERPLARSPAALLLGATVVMLLPSALATNEITPSNLRVVGLLPFVYVFPALGLWALVDRLAGALAARRPALAGALAGAVAPAAGVLLLAALGLVTAGAYFGQWAGSTALYEAADGDLADMAAYLDASELTDTTVYVAALHYQHPTLAALAREYPRIKWLVGGRTLVIPAAGEALVLVPRSVDRGWYAGLLPPGKRLSTPAGPDGQPAFDAYRVGPDFVLAPAQPVQAVFGQTIEWEGYTPAGTPRAGEETAIDLYLRVLSAPDRPDYQAALALADEWGARWAEDVPFQYPSVQWAPGERIVERLALEPAAGAPPGTYNLQLGFYAPAANRYLPLLGEGGRYAGLTAEAPIALDRALSPPPEGALGIEQELAATLATGVTLLGASVETESARPGEPVQLALFWRAERDAPEETRVRLACGDVELYAGAPVHGTYATPGWRAGEVVRDRYAPRLPAGAPPGDCGLQLTALGANGAPIAGPFALGVLRVQAVARNFEVPAMQHAVGATLGGQVELLGYDLSAEQVRPGETVTLTLYWRAVADMDTRYTVFNHLLAPDGSIAGQADGMPQGGAYPTDLWTPGEVVADRYALLVRPDAPAGALRLQVGLYLAATGGRLAADNTGLDAVALQTVEVVR
jgi:hypothetical protein